ncbi:MAG TPA: hypothetical protein VEB43_21400 [Anaeromyxobacter sp.]|nr:hypothetical protein [Anaeromyxobacter sp.]
MIKANSKRNPAINLSQARAQEPTPDDLGPLCNRIALLTFAAAFGVVVGLVTSSAAVASGGGAVALAVGALPLLAAAAAVVRIRALRAELRARRERRDVTSPLAQEAQGASRA